jgi:hypothetical protein
MARVAGRRLLARHAYRLRRVSVVARVSVPPRGTYRPYALLPLMHQKPVQATRRIGLAIAAVIAMIAGVGMAIILLPVASLLPTPGGGSTAKDLATPDRPH